MVRSVPVNLNLSIERIETVAVLLDGRMCVSLFICVRYLLFKMTAQPSVCASGYQVSL